MKVIWTPEAIEDMNRMFGWRGRMGHALWNVRRAVRDAWGRLVRGYGYTEHWSIYPKFFSRHRGILEDLRRHSAGHPGNLTMEEWEIILDQIIEGFKAGERYETSLDETDKDDADKALDLFRMWFWHLWD